LSGSEIAPAGVSLIAPTIEACDRTDKRQSDRTNKRQQIAPTIEGTIASTGVDVIVPMWAL
jgi:hypothetical protein